MRMLLIAGLWLDGRAWAEVVPALAQRGVTGVPLTLPGQGQGQGEGETSATYADQLAAVVAAVDAVPAAEQVVVVGHSAAATLAWAAADARCDRVAGTVLVGGAPVADGQAYADFFEPDGEAVPFPGWGAFDGPDVADLDDDARRELAALTVPVPVSVTRAPVHYADPRRRDKAVVLVCCEFSPEQARAWIGSGQVPELEQASRLRMVDLDSGHWPMTSVPDAFADCLAEAGEWCVRQGAGADEAPTSAP